MNSQLIQSLYFFKDPKMFPDHSFTFGLQPEALSEKDYARMKRCISLKKDFGWRENEELRQVIRKGDIWSDFPAKNYALVGVEFEPGDEKQRIDILSETMVEYYHVNSKSVAHRSIPMVS